MSAQGDNAPPHSIEGEQHVLGALLIDSGAWALVSDLTPADFYRPDHRLIFAAIAKLGRAARGIDLLLVSHELEAAGHLEQAGGLAYLGTLARDTATPANVRAYADIVVERSRLRRLKAFGSDIETAVADGKSSAEIVEAISKPLAQFRAGGARLFDARHAAIGMSTFTETQAPPEFIVEGFLPCDIGTRSAPGGTWKSTIEIWEAVHLIMGWRLYGREVLRPGKVLLVSAEDSLARIRFRLRMMCDQILDLTEVQKRHIADSLLIEDLTGKGLRLVAADADGNLMQTPVVDQLIDAYDGQGLVLVSFDPFVYFGPGERFVNDAEAAMAQAAHRIRNNLDCAVRFIHHTGKANAREGRTDQYSSRGGSALPDGMRFVQVLSKVEQRTQGTPAGISDEDIVRGRAVTLHAPKITDGAPITTPIWIRRMGWRFEHIVPRQDDAQEIDRARQRKIVDFVAAEAESGVRHTQRSLEDGHDKLGIPRNELRRRVHAALELGHLVEMEFSKDQQKGARKTYLAAGVRP